MFKRSFFYRYLSPFVGIIATNVLLRVLSVVFNMALLFGIVPFLSILFGQVDAVMEKPQVTGFSSELILDFLKYELSQFMLVYGQQKTLILVVTAIGLLYVLKNLFGYLALYTFVPVKNGVTRDIRRDVYNKLLILPLSFFSKQQKGDLLTRATLDIQNVDRDILGQTEQVLVDFVLVVMMLAGLFFLNYQLAIFTFFLLPLVTFGISSFSRKLKRSATQMQGDLGQLLVQTEETLGGQKAIKGYQAETYFWKKFQQKNTSFYKLANATARRIDLASPMSEFLGTLAIMSILIFGGWLILSGHHSMSPEILLTFLLFLTQILSPAKNVSTAFFTLKKGKVSVRRIKMILYADEKIVEKPNAIRKQTFDEHIVFQNVSFHYDSLEDDADTAFADMNKTVLHSISLTFEKTKSYAIVGPSGAGKTTVADLLGRFYDCTDGQILIDGIDIRDIAINDLRSLSAYVSQDTILFNDTIANNITFGRKDVSQDELIAAAKVAHAHEFIMETENGYDTVIGDSGMKLSGGQRQRLSIARAILKHAPILILDEATSALDTESEKLVQEAMSELSKTHTTIAIAHRLSTIQHANQIVVMDQGKIIETGTHAELLLKNGLYTRLCRMQTV
ncbi:MAG: ABC transporter ATP-binding protein/permease [Bacteroidales bacterium]|nr:ABC transporter ATP-binding protein/permease [Bacteroidales bacterium]